MAAASPPGVAAVRLLCVGVKPLTAEVRFDLTCRSLLVPVRRLLLALKRSSDRFRLDVGGVGVDVVVIGADWYMLIDRSDVLDWVDLDKRGDLTGSGLDLVVVGVGNVGKEKDFGGDEDDLSAGIDVDLALSLDFGDPDPSCLGVENGFDLDESLTVGLVAIAVGVTTVVVERFLATIGEGEG